MNGWQSAVATLCLVTGSVFDAEHHPMPSVKVYLQPAGKNEAISTQTNSDGVYRFNVPKGSYALHAETQPAESITVATDKLVADLTLQPQFFDQPTFTVAGVTDNRYRGGHGSDTVLRSAESLAKATASLDEPHHTLAESYERSGQPLEAVREFQRAAELHPSEINLFDWGSELLKHRAPEPAAEVFTKGVRLFPQSARMMLGLATAWYSAGSYEKAAQWFFKAVDLDPSDPNPYGFLGKVEAKAIIELPGYQERMARFAKLQPDNALANYYYAVSLCNQRSYAKARALLDKAVTLDPRLGLAYLRLGIIEHSYPAAIHAYQKALEVNPDLEEAHYRLSEAYRLSGDSVRAKQEMAAYNELSKESNEKIERERRETQRFVVALRNTLPAH
jgi:tetratricopeptide (TPR) repeat protein